MRPRKQPATHANRRLHTVGPADHDFVGPAVVYRAGQRHSRRWLHRQLTQPPIDLLYLQRGRYDGKQVVPAEWVDLATSRQASNGSNPDSDWDQGYGFQFWRSRHGYRGDGAFGQFCLILPEQNTVIAITSGTGDMGGVMNLLWTKLLPEFRATALPANPSALQTLQKKLSSLQLSTPKGARTNETATRVSGKTYRFPENSAKLESLQWKESAQGASLLVRTDGKDYTAPIGHGNWARGGFHPRVMTDGHFSAAGAWTDAQTYQVKLCYFRSPFVDTVDLTFTGNQLTVRLKPNVGFGPQEAEEIVGTAE